VASHVKHCAFHCIMMENAGVISSLLICFRHQHGPLPLLNRMLSWVYSGGQALLRLALHPIWCLPTLFRQLQAAARRGRFGAARAADNAQRLEEVGAKVCACCLASASLESSDAI
jgi:hypothetical protein